MTPSATGLLPTLPDPRGGWVGRSFGHSGFSGDTAGANVRIRMRRLEPGGEVTSWRTATDTVLFHHGGVPLTVVLSDPSGAPTRVVLGQPTPSAHVPQLVVTAGTEHSITADPGSADALWTEVEVPTDAPAETDPMTTVVGCFDRLQDRLLLTSHPEGGYYRQTYQSGGLVSTPRGQRYVANSIFYLLDQRSPIGHLHSNTSDITHFIHGPGPIRYRMLAPDGTLHEQDLGTDVDAGQVPVMTCPAGWWKSSEVAEVTGEGLISELVAPGFDFADQAMITPDDLAERFPHHVLALTKYVWAG